MKNLFFAVLGLALFLTSATANAQTNGTLTFTYTETVSTAKKNVMAVWIEDNSGTFVKTKMRFWGNGTSDHLPAWVSKSAKNTVDAITGATLTSSTNPTAFGVKTVVWDGKNIDGTLVADGTYKVFVETAWDDPEPSKNQHSAIISFSFEKKSTSNHLTPAGSGGFSNITLDWVPATVTNVNVMEENIFSLYPNPTNGLVNLTFNKQVSASRILVENIKGEVVYQERINQTLSDKKSLNLSQLPAGIYFIEVVQIDNSGSYKTKVIVN